MGKKSAIEWTDSTWNPSTGCNKVSPGCKNCYAEALSMKLQKMGMKKYANGFEFAMHPQDLEIPYKWADPRMIFVNSMSDLFHEKMPTDFLLKVFGVMHGANWHTYQILTKRPERMLTFTKEYVRRHGPIGEHIWLGASVESYPFIKRIETLRQVPVKVRFISFEPLLDTALENGRLDLTGISWAIVGGESGQNYRPVKPEWVREIRDKCLEQKVAFFFKQWGGLRPKSGGKILDGVTWTDYPAGALERLKNGKEPVQVKLG